VKLFVICSCSGVLGTMTWTCSNPDVISTIVRLKKVEFVIAGIPTTITRKVSGFVPASTTYRKQNKRELILSYKTIHDEWIFVLSFVKFGNRQGFDAFTTSTQNYNVCAEGNRVST